MQKKDISIRVGSLIILFIALLLGLFLFLKKGIFSPQYNLYYIRFSNVSGLNEGSKVTLAGVLIGHVRQITLLDAESVQVSVEVESNVKIPRESSVHLTSSLIGIGDQELEIIPPRLISGYIRPNSTLIGQKISQLSSAFPEVYEMIAEMTDAVRAVKKVLTSEETKSGMKYFFKSLDENLNRLGSFIETVDGIASENRKHIYLALEDLAEGMEYVKNFSKKVAQGGYDQKVVHLMEKAEQSLDKSRFLIEEMHLLIKDKNWRDPFVKSMKNSEKITASGVNIAKDFESIAKKGNIAVDKTNNVLDRVDELSVEAGGALKDFKKKMEIFSGLGSYKVKTSSEIGYNLKNNRLKTDFNLEIPLFGKEYVIGLFDAFESNRLNLQAIKKTGNNSRIRYGAHAGKPGVGVDLDYQSGFSLHGDVYGLNRSYFDVKARYKINKDIAAWVSLQDLFQQNIPSIGIGILK